jgi:hypothetical protein
MRLKFNARKWTRIKKQINILTILKEFDLFDLLSQILTHNLFFCCLTWQIGQNKNEQKY